jgi:chromosome segregation protein
LVYIKKLEIFGFKSFGSKSITLNLQRGLIVVTGPNGSGKSNILDAILFALGENSPKALRVDRFQSLFHDTSTNNNTNKTVKVSLTFDNVDRGIPVDKDNVTITREMSGINSGESQYTINGKKVSRNNIMELLEIVVASPNKLNIVQQGMITRISELNSEDRRKIIEDIIGLSYFDEKKNQAMKQLEESDRRLEIALTKMDDVRNRIDELESERNDQHRFIQLELEIKRLKAIKISEKLRRTINDITNFNDEIKIKENNIKLKSNEVINFNQQIEKLNKEKEQFLILSNNSNKEKKELETKLSSVIYQYERTNAIIKESQYYFNQINQKEKNNILEQQIQYKKLKEYEEQLTIIENKIEIENNNKKEVKKKFEEIVDEIEEKNRLNLNEINRKNFLESRLKKLIRLQGEFEVIIVRNEEKVKNISDKIRSNDNLIQELLIEQEENEKKTSELNNEIKEVYTNTSKLRNNSNKIESESIKLSEELEISKKITDNAEKAILKYDEKMKLAKNILTEDHAIATLLKDFKNLGIIGYVFSLLKWDEMFQKAIIASGNEWMKSIVVKDIKSMVILAEFSKNNGIPFLKIIPTELLDGGKVEKIPDDPSILGLLSDFVYCEIKNLPEFLFGNIILTKNPVMAYLLSKNGYKAVSVTGEIFFPNLSLMQFDYGSKISDLTKDILSSHSIESLKIAMEKLRTLTKRKITDLNYLNEENSKVEKILNSNEFKISDLNKQIKELKNLINKQQQDSEKLIGNNTDNSSAIDKIANIFYRYKSRFIIAEKAINKIKDCIGQIEKENGIGQIEMLNKEQKKISNELEVINNRLRELTLTQSLLRNNFDNTSIHYQNTIKEKEVIEKEKAIKKMDLEKARIELKEIEVDLETLREKEDKIIQSTSSTYAKLQEYELTYRKLTDNEKKTSRELNLLEKEMAIINKDILDLENKKTNLINELQELGYKETLESYDVENIYQELKIEYENIKERINLRADETYLEIIEGYRGMSNKKNQLEEERNSIIRFIAETGKEKEIVFTNAFKKVDEDIRKTFSEITGGSACLELEDPENIFSGGILLMVQFPNKHARESTGLSGGEKTMAAIVFLLALQSLKPSPFYLMDEVDAHLDAQNTERLSKILLLRSSNNQIIMVTLKDSTVSKSDIIFGVYPKNGISQVVKYNHPSKVKVIK